jgi:hypothetical protein
MSRIRKVFVVDQIRMARPADADVMRESQPLKTMQEVQNFLTSKHIDYRRVTDNIDAVGSDPKLIDTILRLPAGEIFTLPSGFEVLFNQVRETRVVPYTGEPAITYALDVLHRQRMQETVTKSFGAIVAKSATSVRYNKAYQPPAPAADKATEPAPAEEKAPQPASVPGGALRKSD